MEKPGTRGRLLLVALVGALTVTPPSARGAEAWVVCFATAPVHYAGEPGCESLAWQDLQYFFNSNPTAATVRLLGTSNGPRSPLAQDITIGANSLFARSAGAGVEGLAWDPCLGSCPVTIFVAHLDVPEGVFLSSRAEVFALAVGACPPEVRPKVLAGLPLPVKRELTPAGVPQQHLGIDTGTDDGAAGGASSASARTSIGIYNPAAVAANATIEIRRGCDDVVIERRTVTVPPNSLVQFGGFAWDTSGCGFFKGKAPSYSAYAVVTVDQPSFSYAISLRNDMPPKFAGTAPVTQ